jgi:pimeloyl-ACP methyl ester carboxylesterase
VGSSLGGWIAAEIATRNATRLASLTLVGPPGIRIKGVPMGDMFIWSPEEAIRKLFFDQAIADRVLSAKLSDEQIEVQMKNRFAATKYCWQPRLYDPDLEKWLHRIKIPSQVIWGANDELIPSQYAQHWQSQIEGSQMSILDKCGHLLHLEAPDALFGKVQTMIDRVSA